MSCPAAAPPRVFHQSQLCRRVPRQAVCSCHAGPGGRGQALPRFCVGAHLRHAMGMGCAVWHHSSRLRHQRGEGLSREGLNCVLCLVSTAAAGTARREPGVPNNLDTAPEICCPAHGSHRSKPSFSLLLTQGGLAFILWSIHVQRQAKFARQQQLSSSACITWAASLLPPQRVYRHALLLHP